MSLRLKGAAARIRSGSSSLAKAAPLPARASETWLRAKRRMEQPVAAKDKSRVARKARAESWGSIWLGVGQTGQTGRTGRTEAQVQGLMRVSSRFKRTLATVVQAAKPLRSVSFGGEADGVVASFLAWSGFLTKSARA